MIVDRDLRDRIAFLRFVMIAGIVLLHTPNYVPIGEVGSDPFALVKAFFQHAVFRATVPVLSMISGFLLFGAELDRAPARLWAKKSRTILLPFLFFNLSVLAAAYVAQAAFQVKLSYDLTAGNLKTWLDAAFGLTWSPVNYPLNFLRDLIVLMALAPLFGWLLRRAAWPGLVLVCLVFFMNLEGPLVLRHSMPVLFYVGGMAATRRWNLRRLDAWRWPMLLLFLAICAGYVHFAIENTTHLRLLAPVLIWPITATAARTAFGQWCARMSEYSFFIFLAHAPVLMASWLLYQRLGGVPYPVYWCLTPVATIALLVGVYRAAQRWAPRPFNAILGNRALRRPAAPLGREAAPAFGQTG